jgi:hypothetical protein
MPSCVAEANPFTVPQAVACEYALQPDVWEGAEMQAIAGEVLNQLSQADHFVNLLGYGKAHSLHAIEVRRDGGGARVARTCCMCRRRGVPCGVRHCPPLT